MLKRALASLFSCLLLLTACAQTPTTPDKYAKVTRFADDNIYVQNIEESMASDGTMKVAVFGAATVTFDQKVRYRANWYDQDNFPIKTSVSNWNELKLDGKGIFEFYVVAPGPRAKRYLLEFETH